MADESLYDGPPPEGIASARPRDGAYREVTLSAILFGAVVGAVMNAAITYAGLKIGFTIVGSSIAAVLGFGVLRGVLRRGSILEVNIGQTIASAVNTPNSGVIFTVPVLFLLGVPLLVGDSPNTNFWLITAACVVGAALGGAFIVPLRKQMLDIERLRFPSATAVGAILRSPGAGPLKSVLLLLGIVLSVLIAAPAQLPGVKTAAAVEDLPGLRYAETIGDYHVSQTLLISAWIESGSVPPELVAHGVALAAVADAKRDRDAVLATRVANKPEFRAERRQRTLAARKAVTEAEAAAEEAAKASLAAINATLDPAAHGPYVFTSYPDELAKRAQKVASGEAPIGTLRSTKCGWAPKPLWGYSDLQIRDKPTVKGDASFKDYGYNGFVAPGQAVSDPVLAVEVDHDRSGRPDLLVRNDHVNVGRLLGFLPAGSELIFAIAPFCIGAGFLSGRAGLYCVVGGVLAYLLLNPIVYGMGWMPESVQPHDAPSFGFTNINRPLGIGLLLGGAMAGVLAALPAVRQAFKSIAASGSAIAGASKDELGIKVVIFAALAGGAFLFVTANQATSTPLNERCPVTAEHLDDRHVSVAQADGYTVGFATEAAYDSWSNEWTDAERQGFLQSDELRAKPGWLASVPPTARAIVLAVVGVCWIWFAGIIIAQCTGMTDWSPISGMALLTVVLVMLLAGTGNVIAAVMLGAALCVAITCASDMMADLKTGYIVGSVPRRQQIVELIATGIGPVITMGVLLVIVQLNLRQTGVPIGEGTGTPAPQAQALQAVINGMQGQTMPYVLYGGGALLGGLLGLGAFSGLGVLVGLSMYLPMEYIATYGLGCLLFLLLSRVKGRRWCEEWGVPLAAGMIVGDPILSLGVNMYVLVTG